MDHGRCADACTLALRLEYGAVMRYPIACPIACLCMALSKLQTVLLLFVFLEYAWGGACMFPCTQLAAWKSGPGGSPVSCCRLLPSPRNAAVPYIKARVSLLPSCA